MKHFNAFIAGFLIVTGALWAQILPKLGNDTLLDVACWNIEWFGDVTNGPSNEQLQYNNVKRVLTETDLDVWGLCEVSNTTTYATLMGELSNLYNGYISDFSATQKTALLYKKTMFTLIPALSFNISLNATQNFHFASRPPLQVALQTIGGNKTDTIFFIVVHLKALSDQDSYNRRVASSAFLKTYVEQNLTGKKFMIIGDWNDMLRFSTFNQQTSPFKNLLDANYQFISKPLEEAGRRSYAFSASFIDHIMISHTLDSFYINNSAGVWDNAGTFINNFSNNTSDHYPVYGWFNWKNLTTLPNADTITTSTVATIKNPVVQVYPNPANKQIQIIFNDGKNITAQLVNTAGKTVAIASGNHYLTIQTEDLPEGIYWLLVQANNEVIMRKKIVIASNE
jgi:hypothetical protein